MRIEQINISLSLFFLVAIVAACFSIIAVFVAFVNHKEQTLYKEIE
jgi:hypothetical protein